MSLSRYLPKSHLTKCDEHNNRFDFIKTYFAQKKQKQGKTIQTLHKRKEIHTHTYTSILHKILQ